MFITKITLLLNKIENIVYCPTPISSFAFSPGQPAFQQYSDPGDDYLPPPPQNAYIEDQNFPPPPPDQPRGYGYQVSSTGEDYLPLPPQNAYKEDQKHPPPLLTILGVWISGKFKYESE